MKRRDLFRLGLALTAAAVTWAPLEAAHPPQPRATPRAPWALVAHTAVVAVASPATVTTAAINTTGASLIVVIYAGQLTSAPTDSLGNTNWYTPPKQPSSGGYGVSLSFIVNPITGPAHTFTVTGGGSTYPALAILAFAGSFGGAELTRGAYVAGSGSVQPGSITPSSSGALLVTGYGNNGGTGTFTIDSGFTVGDQLAAAANGGPVASAYLIQSTAAPINPTWATTGGATGAVTQVISFPLAAAGSTGGGEVAIPF